MMQSNEHGPAAAIGGTVPPVTPATRQKTPPPVPVSDPRVTELEKPRLGAQCQAIVDRLRRGPATNRELSEIAIRYSSRIHDLRQAGYAIELTARHLETGLTVYELRGEP